VLEKHLLGLLIKARSFLIVVIINPVFFLSWLVFVPEWNFLLLAERCLLLIVYMLIVVFHSVLVLTAVIVLMLVSCCNNVVASGLNLKFRCLNLHL
jgi:hypothetical protein